MRIVSRCLETKVPEEKRGDGQRSLDMLKRAMANQTMAADSLRQYCKATLVSTVRYDSYGCYADEAVRRGIQTSCSVMTHAELEAALDAKLENGVQDGIECRYDFADNAFRHPFKMTVRWKDGKDEVATERAAQAMVSGRLQKEARKGDIVEGDAVDNLGDEAFFTIAGIWPMLTARRGDVSVSVEGASREQLIQIARTALGRLKEEDQ